MSEYYRSLTDSREADPRVSKAALYLFSANLLKPESKLRYTNKYERNTQNAYNERKNAHRRSVSAGR